MKSFATPSKQCIHGKHPQDIAVAWRTPALLSAAVWHTEDLADAAAAYVHTASAGCGGRLDAAAAAQQLNWLATGTAETDGALPVAASAMRAALHRAALACHLQAASAPLHVLLAEIQSTRSAAMVASLPLETCASAAVVHAATEDVVALPPPIKAAQLQCLATAMKHTIVSTDGDVPAARARHAADDWQWLAGCWTQTVHAHRAQIPVVHHAAIDRAMQQLAAPGACVDLPAVAAALDATTHPLFASLVATHMLPALELLNQWRAGKDTELAARGEAWCLLGVAQLQLLVPPVGVDPARAAYMQLHVLADCLQRSVLADHQVMMTSLFLS